MEISWILPWLFHGDGEPGNSLGKVKLAVYGRRQQRILGRLKGRGQLRG
jgi:hypothetical protein